jgi:hypothetical protein
MDAPQRFVEWMSEHSHPDKKWGHVYRYHSRGDAHSVALCKFVLQDLWNQSPLLREQSTRREVAYGINLAYKWPITGKEKTIDLAIGKPVVALPSSMFADNAPGIVQVTALNDVVFSCEAKSVMTEHNKSQPRVFDELSASHEIVHRGNPLAIAAGITVVNIADRFASPLRQVNSTLIFTTHNQPKAAAGMINHLRGLAIRDTVGEVGFDAYCTIVIDTDNQRPAVLCTDSPAPQPGDRDHYETFIKRIVKFYMERFS